MSWVRHARDMDALPGRGLKCWVAAQAQDWAGAAVDSSALPPAQPAGSGEVRVLIGNRRLMAEEDVVIGRRAPLLLIFPTLGAVYVIC